MTTEKDKLDDLTVQIYIQNPDPKTAFDLIHRICNYELAKLAFQIAREPCQYYEISESRIPELMRTRELYRIIKGAIEDNNRIGFDHPKPNLST